MTLAIKSQDSAMIGMKHPELCPRREGGMGPGRKAELPGAPQEPMVPVGQQVKLLVWVPQWGQ